MTSSPEYARRAALVLVERSTINPSHAYTLGCLHPVTVDFVSHIIRYFNFASERRCVERERVRECLKKLHVRERYNMVIIPAVVNV